MQPENRFGSATHHMHVRRSMVVRINDYPKAVELHDCRHSNRNPSSLGKTNAGKRDLRERPGISSTLYGANLAHALDLMACSRPTKGLLPPNDEKIKEKSGAHCRVTS